MTTKEKELVRAYKKYIDFLGNAYDNVFAIASVHNYSCSEKDIKLGQELRDTIQKLEEELEEESSLYTTNDLTDYLY